MGSNFTLSTLNANDLPAEMGDVESVAARLLRVEKKIDRLLAATTGHRPWVNISEAARIAGVSRTTFQRHHLERCRTRVVGNRVEVRRADAEQVAKKGEE